jgi:hypothetical protein
LEDTGYLFYCELIFFAHEAHFKVSKPSGKAALEWGFEKAFGVQSRPDVLSGVLYHGDFDA